MIIKSMKELTDHIRQQWTGQTVSVTKTVPTPDIRLTLKGARVVSPDEVNDTIRERYPDDDAQFLVFFGEDEPVHSVIIHIDNDTVFDVRNKRLVVLTNDEVVQLSPDTQSTR